jgi:hypothetical protein
VLEELRMDVVDQREWRRLDPRALVLKNMNTPKDYAEARKWWGVEALRESHSIKKPRRERAIRPRAATVQSR